MVGLSFIAWEMSETRVERGSSEGRAKVGALGGSRFKVVVEIIRTSNK